MSMILYNVRHRGSYEYEKFVLNAFQLSNEIQMLLKKVDTLSQDNLISVVNKLDIIINNLSAPNSVSHQLLFLKMAMED